MRRSERNKREKYGTRAETLLESFYWEEDEVALLELAVSQEIDFSDIRQLQWGQVHEGIGCLVVKKREIVLTEKTLKWFMDILSTQPLADEKVFTHQTGKKIQKELDSFKV